MAKHEQSGSWQGPTGWYFDELEAPREFPPDSPEEAEVMELLKTHTVEEILQIPDEGDILTSSS